MSNQLPHQAPRIPLTQQALKAFARSDDTKTCVRAYLLAKAFAECERVRVDAYIKPLFELYTFKVAERFQKRRGCGELVTKPDDLFLCEDEAEMAKFYAECDKEHRKHGFTGKPGQCPALVAESLAILAENTLLEHTLNELPLGIEMWQMHGENRKKMLKLTISMVVQEFPAEFTKEKLMAGIQPS